MVKPIQRFELLELLRAVAALLVVLFHTQMIVGRIGGSYPFGMLVQNGDKGVDLFFVLSGFVMAFVHRGDIGRPRRFGRYAYSRVSRIYPSVWIVTLLGIAIYVAGFNAGKTDKLSPGGIIASLLLLPQAGDAIVNVTWTLKYEMFFYALFGIVILAPRIGGTLLAAWLVAAAAGWGASGSGGQAIAFYLQPIVLEFGIGIGVAAIVARRLAGAAAPPAWHGVLLLAFGVTMFVAAALFEPYANTGLPLLPRFATYGLSGGFIVLGSCLLEMAVRPRLPPAALFLGAASYAIYLVHFSAITLFATLLAKSGHAARGNLAAGAVACCGIAGGIAFYLVVDRPVARRLGQMRGWLFRPTTSRA